MCLWGPHSDLPGGRITIQIKLYIGAWWNLLHLVWGEAPRWWEVTTYLVFAVPGKSPRNAAGSCKLTYNTLRQFNRKQCLSHQHRFSWLMSKCCAPRTKGVSPHIPLQAGYRREKQGLIHIWLYKLRFSNCLGTWRWRSTGGNKDRRDGETFTVVVVLTVLPAGGLPRCACTSVFIKCYDYNEDYFISVTCHPTWY
jgi:hypothetical protein